MRRPHQAGYRQIGLCATIPHVYPAIRFRSTIGKDRCDELRFRVPARKWYGYYAWTEPNLLIVRRMVLRNKRKYYVFEY